MDHAELLPVLRQHLNAVAAQPSLLQERAKELQHYWQSPQEDAAHYADLLLATERVLKIHAAGKQNDAALISQLGRCEPQDWFDLPALPCSVGKQKRLAKSMLKAVGLEEPPPGAVLRINPAIGARHPAEQTLQYCIDKGIAFNFEFEDAAFDTALINASDENGIDGLIALRRARIAPCTYNLKFASELTAEMAASRIPEKFNRYNSESMKDYYQRLKNEDIQWNLTYIPTEEEAQMDGFDYPAYLDFFFEACDQPWDAVRVAQQHLKKPFNAAKELHITNDDGTDIRMSLEGHTFANSVVDHNTPGSEIFSGPVRESLNGVIVAKGNFAITHPISGKMRDITLRFVNGRIVEGHAAEGNEDLQKVLAFDDARDPSDPKFEGSRHVGEIGIGTNPHIRQHLVNGLLVEKIGGSFHVALGSCYGNTYLGEEALMSNGNKSDIHWDLTTMLRGRGGRMELDGHLIQKDGEWIDCPALDFSAKDVDVLNRGWAAIPEPLRPAYWRDKLAAEAKVTR